MLADDPVMIDTCASVGAPAQETIQQEITKATLSCSPGPDEIDCGTGQNDMMLQGDTFFDAEQSDVEERQFSLPTAVHMATMAWDSLLVPTVGRGFAADGEMGATIQFLDTRYVMENFCALVNVTLGVCTGPGITNVRYFWP